MFLFFFNDTATTEIYTLSLHDALPISSRVVSQPEGRVAPCVGLDRCGLPLHPGAGDVRRQSRRRVAEVCGERDRKSTRLNSSHANISYAVFCLKKKKPT